MRTTFALLCINLMLGGCAGTFAPRTVAEQESGYTYVPVDPFPVKMVPGDGCPQDITTTNEYVTLLKSLPDNAVRMLIEQFDRSGSVTYGPAKLGTKGESYRVTVDYINADTINVPVWISKEMKSIDGKVESVPLLSPPDDRFLPGSEVYTIVRKDPDSTVKMSDNFVEFNIPVYVGIGLRVAAVVDVVGASANISGIGVIGAEAETDNLKGSLVVQTLGVNGKSIAAALPIQSELNRTTAQNAIVAVGSIKALLYAPETINSPRVVGFYLPFPGGKPLVNALISEISRRRVEWPRPCQLAGF